MYNKNYIDSVADVTASYFSKAHVRFPRMPTDCFPPQSEPASHPLSSYALMWTGADLLRTWEGRSYIKTLIAAVSEDCARWIYLCSQDLHGALQCLNVTWDTVSQINASFRFALLLCFCAFENNTTKVFCRIHTFFGTWCKNNPLCLRWRTSKSVISWAVFRIGSQ